MKLEHLWDHLAEIVTAAGSTSLTLYALCIIIVAIVTISLMRKTSAAARIVVVVCWIAIVAGFAWLIPAPPDLLALLNVSGRPIQMGKHFTVMLGALPIKSHQAICLVLRTSSDRDNSFSLVSADPALKAVWKEGGASQTVSSIKPKAIVLSFDVSAAADQNFTYDVLVDAGNKNAFEIEVIFVSANSTVQIVRDSDPLPSGRGQDTGPTYQKCVTPPASNYVLQRETVTFSLTGDRSCNSYSSCRLDFPSPNVACLSFNMQGHSEDGSVRNSSGHISASYSLEPSLPELTSK